MPQLPLENQIKDQVTLIFNKIRAKKFEISISKSLNEQIQLHGGRYDSYNDAYYDSFIQ